MKTQQKTSEDLTTIAKELAKHLVGLSIQEATIVLEKTNTIIYNGAKVFDADAPDSTVIIR